MVKMGETNSPTSPAFTEIANECRSRSRSPPARMAHSGMMKGESQEIDEPQDAPTILQPGSILSPTDWEEPTIDPREHAKEEALVSDPTQVQTEEPTMDAKEEQEEVCKTEEGEPTAVATDSDGESVATKKKNDLWTTTAVPFAGLVPHLPPPSHSPNDFLPPPLPKDEPTENENAAADYWTGGLPELPQEHVKDTDLPVPRVEDFRHDSKHLFVSYILFC